ncbi:MAG TPA: hypothetical protein PLI96_11190 [Halothiobacillus sp.]|nr:hypothetical protein [Halothiobacillus sp.]
MNKILLAAIFLNFSALCSAQAQSGSLFVCVDHVDPDDWKGAWQNGPINVPAGAVFEYAGHILSGNLQNPKDLMNLGKDGWTDVSKAESDRRAALLTEDSQLELQDASAAVTTSEITLTMQHPCGLAPAASLIDPADGWSIFPIFGNSGLYFEIAGVIIGGKLNNNYSDGTPFDFVAQVSELHASVRGTLTQKIHLGTNGQ